MFTERNCRKQIASVLAGALLVAVVQPALAVGLPQVPAPDTFSELMLLTQYNGETSSEAPSSRTDSIGDERDPRLSESYGLNDGVTRGVVWMISNESSACKDTLRPEYRFDCLKIALARAASTIENRPNYRQAARELRSLSRKLDGIVTRYRDTSAPRVTEGRRSYRAVSKANLAQANREAAAAIDETVTKLLRSAGNSEKRKIHYSQIATAVGSTKRLLRS